MLVHFRQRIGLELINKVNQILVKRILENTSNQEEEKTAEKKLEVEKESPITNKGKLIIDATCAPSDISYPNDLGLLNQARVQTEKIIDELYKSSKNTHKKKPRTHRNKARKEYLKIAKQRKPKVKERQKAIKKQLQYIKRNNSHIDILIEQGASLKKLNKKNYKMLLVVAEVDRQQLLMFKENTHKTVDALRAASRRVNRIVSLSQPHIRPIVRGKAGKAVEFGAKISVSCFVDLWCASSLRVGYVFLDHLSWDNFNESGDLKAQVEAYKKFTGY